MDQYASILLIAILTISSAALVINYAPHIIGKGLLTPKHETVSCLSTSATQQGSISLNTTEASGPDWKIDAPYRVPFNSTYSGDVLIVMDTASLISEGKMNSDCSGIDITNATGGELAFWIEGGCNTPNTRIWVSMPSAGSGYIYYGGTTGSELSWSGKFFYMSNTSCPSGFTMESGSGGQFYHRFFRGNSSFGQTGGSDTENGGGTLSVGSSGSSGTVGTAPQTGSHYCAAAGHVHTFTINIANASIIPRYFDVIVCSNSKFETFTGLIGMFESLPPGWAYMSDFENRFPRGSDSYGGTGGSDTHSHSFSGSYSGWAGSYVSTLDTSPYTSCADDTHGHTVSGTTPVASNIPPYYTLVFGTGGSNASGIILMANSLPPLGYERLSSLDNRFPRVYSSSGLTGGSETHTHSVSVTTSGGDDSTSTIQSSQTNVASPSHTHTLTFEVTGSNIPPYISVLFVKREPEHRASLGQEEKRVVSTTTEIRIPLENIGSKEFKASKAYVVTTKGTFFSNASIDIGVGEVGTGRIYVNASLAEDEIREIRIIPDGCINPVKLKQTI